MQFEPLYLLVECHGVVEVERGRHFVTPEELDGTAQVAVDDMAPAWRRDEGFQAEVFYQVAHCWV